MEHHPMSCVDPFCTECETYWTAQAKAESETKVETPHAKQLEAGERVMERFGAAMGRLATVEAIDHPPHYTHSKIEPIDVIEQWALPHHLACTVKYLARYRYKGAPLEDLKKARWYLDRWITLLEKA